jgi:transposase
MQMVELGYTAKEVVEKERVNPCTAYGIVSRYRVQKRGQSRDRSGCPTKISEREKRYIIRLIEDNPFICNKDIHRRAQLSYCIRTLIYWLRSEGIQYIYILQRPKLTTTYAQLRLEFAQGLINKPIL